MNILGYELIKKEKEICGYGKPIFSILVCEKGITLAGPNGEGKPIADPRMILLATVLGEQFNNNWATVSNTFSTNESIQKWLELSIDYNNNGYTDPFSQSLIYLLKQNQNIDNREVG